MEVNSYQQLFAYSSKYCILCSSKERNSYSFRTTWGWENDDRIIIWEFTIEVNGANL